MVPAGMGIGLPISEASREVMQMQPSHIFCEGYRPQSKGAYDPLSHLQVAPPNLTCPQAPLKTHNSKELQADGDSSTNAQSISSSKFYLLLFALNIIKNCYQDLSTVGSTATIPKELHDSTLKAKQLLLDDILSQLFPKLWVRAPYDLFPNQTSQSQVAKPAPKPPLCTSPPIPREETGFLVSHMVQVFSVAFHPQFEFDDGRPCKIFGNIAVEDDDVNVFIYSKKRSVAEAIPSCGGNLSLIEDEEDNFIDCSCKADSVTMYLSLKDAVRDVYLFYDREVTLHPEDADIEESCDKLMKATVQGDHGFACIYYAKFLHAVTARVSISIIQNDTTTTDVNCPSIDVYGSVVARYGNAKRFCNGDQVEHMTTMLFNKPDDQSQCVKIGRCINLTRYLVAVPAYDSLIIEADLMYSNREVARGSASFLADCYEVTQVIHGEHFDIKVQVRWDGYRLSDYNNDCDLSEYTSAFRRTFLGPYAKEKYGTRPSGSKFDSLNKKGGLFGDKRGEVFSVYVAGMDHNISSVCGRIRVNDYNQWDMFNRSRVNPHILTTDKMIGTLECHDEIEYNDFKVEMRLKDPVTNLELSKGLICWNEGSLSNDAGKSSYYDRALCSIVHGSHGYAVVHYIIYQDACNARVEISIFHKNPSVTGPINVCGSVIATNTNFDYATPYLKKYFRSRLFDKPLAEPVQLPSHSNIPLSKSVVAVSTFASLAIEVNLQAMSIDNTIIDVVCGEKQIVIDFDEIFWHEFQGEHYCVKLSVKFERCGLAR